MLVSVIIAAVQIILQFLGISIGKDGVNINWRRILLWALISPVVVLVGSRIVSVFGDAVQMFRIWGGGSGDFALGVIPRAISSMFPPAGTSTRFQATLRVFYECLLVFGVDRIIALSLQILGIRILLKNSDRIFSAITGVVHTTISVMSK